MSYREEGDSVILTMSRDDYDFLLLLLAAGTAAHVNACGRTVYSLEIKYGYDPVARILEFLNRLNQGNPNYTPYQVENAKAKR